jgi:hypothetical protein
LAGRPRGDSPVSAALAIPVAPSKAIVETPLAFPAFAPIPIESQANQSTWDQLTEIESGRVRLSDNTLALMAELNGDSDDFEQMVSGFRRSIARDTVVNRYSLERRVHEHLAKHPKLSFEQTNRYIYNELFLTPKSDPWLGLKPDNAFSALPGGGAQTSD